MNRKRILSLAGLVAAMFFGAQSDFSYSDGLFALVCLLIPAYYIFLHTGSEEKA